MKVQHSKQSGNFLLHPPEQNSLSSHKLLIAFQVTLLQHYWCKGQSTCSAWGVIPKTGILTPNTGILGLVTKHQPLVLFKDVHSG